ncbi:MAG: flagellar assembly protein FliH [Gammaproteobacteria bacterium]|jgi:flagellar assembly protein FliH|nr:flagellar assembly protein FliH [Pseudomonadota bacterium]QOJ20404.1 MAG: flagellar assembly protein FliH [Gammaproteobacteria bacterium]
MMASNFVPKEKLSAYRRWEMDSFETSDAPQEIPEVEAESNVTPDDQPQAALPSEEEVATVFQNAKDKGYAAGLQEGHATGYAEGRAIAETEVKAEVARIQALLLKLDQDLQQMDQQVAASLLELAIALTKKMVTEALQLQPELIVPIVQEAIRNLPHVTQHPRLFLHPEDAKLVLAHLSEQLEQDHWCVREDEQLSRGGCRIEAGGSEVNGSMEVRWQRVLSTIGQTDGWLDKADRHDAS